MPGPVPDLYLAYPSLCKPESLPTPSVSASTRILYFLIACFLIAYLMYMRGLFNSIVKEIFFDGV